MPCCHNQWVKPVMADLTDDRSSSLKLQDRIKGGIQERFCTLKAEMWLQKLVLEIAEELRKHGWPQTKSLLQLIHTVSRACKIGQALKSGLLGKDKNCLINCRTIGVLIRPIFLALTLPDMLKGHNSCNTVRYLAHTGSFLDLQHT